MKIGDTVKVLSRKALPPGQDIWSRGKVLSVREIEPPVSTTVYKIGFGEFSSYEEREFERHEIKSYQEQSDEDYNANVERDIPIGLALANEALAELLPGEVVVFNDADGELSAYHGGVTISPTQYDQPKIGGLIERTGWEVTTWDVQPSTRWHPEECTDSPVGTFPTIQRAVQALIETIFKLKAKDYWNAKADAAQAEAWAAGEM
jgi:hypothetical protein